MTHDQIRALIDAQFADGPLPPLQDQALRAHVRKCTNCKVYYDRVSELEIRLSGDQAVIERLQARGRPPAKTNHRRRWIGGLAAAAGVALAVGLWRSAPEAPEWTPKGSDGAATMSTRIFHKPIDGEAQRLGDRMRASDGLLVSYTNPKGGATHLAVVARDAHGRVLWVQPPWTDPAARPQSAAIQQGVADHELPAVIHHDLKAGALDICSVFGDAPRDIATWDAELAQAWPPRGAHCRRVEVAQ